MAVACVDHGKAWKAFAKKVHSAEPGSTLYVPHPFPQADQQVIDDFLYQHQEAFGDMPFDQLAAPERRFFSAVRSKTVRFEVLRIENWSPLRCGPERQRSFYFLVRVIEKDGGAEIARAALEDSGLLVKIVNKPEDRHLPPLAGFEASAKLALRKTGVQGRDLQYVTTWGNLRCDTLAPCVVSRSGSTMLLVKGSEVYRLDPGRKRFSFARDLGAPGAMSNVARDLGTRGEKLVSLGQDVFAAAVPIGK
jgi:hypothetical protein